MLIRIPIAFIVGLFEYLIAAFTTVYDGILSFIGQPIMGSILTMLALFVILLLGSPLLITRVWFSWSKHSWISVTLFFIGIILMILSWHPALRVQLIDHETKATVDSFHPAAFIGGWLITMFATSFCPILGIRKDRRWV